MFHQLSAIYLTTYTSLHVTWLFHRGLARIHLPIQMKGSNFRIVALEVGEIEVIFQRLLLTWEPESEKGCVKSLSHLH